jgi:hypothetical protein
LLWYERTGDEEYKSGGGHTDTAVSVDARNANAETPLRSEGSDRDVHESVRLFLGSAHTRVAEAVVGVRSASIRDVPTAQPRRRDVVIAYEQGEGSACVLLFRVFLRVMGDDGM